MEFIFSNVFGFACEMEYTSGRNIVLLLSDLRTTLHGNHLINAMEGKALAKKLDMLFFETSSLQLKGLHECVNAAVSFCWKFIE